MIIDGPGSASLGGRSKTFQRSGSEGRSAFPRGVLPSAAERRALLRRRGEAQMRRAVFKEVSGALAIAASARPSVSQ